MSITIFQLGKPKLLLAPMAGLTHAAFRELVTSYGGCSLYFTEMLNVRALVFQNPEKDPYLIKGTKDRPLFAQLVGKDPELFAKAVKKLDEVFSFDGYDVNFGCARGVIQRYGWGASLLREPRLCVEILLAVKENTAKPISAKIRSPEHRKEELLNLVEEFFKAGISFLTFHPRAPQDGFRRPARWEEISWLKKAFPNFPIIGNGDVFSPQDAQKMLLQCGCEGVMIGRAALLRPWIFRDTLLYLKGEKIPPPPPSLEAPEKLAKLIAYLLPEEIQEKRFELWLFWYLQNFPYGLHYFGKIKKQKGLAAKLALLQELLAKEKIGPYPARPYLLR